MTNLSGCTCKSNNLLFGFQRCKQDRTTLICSNCDNSITFGRKEVVHYENYVKCKNLIELLRTYFLRRVNTRPYLPLLIIYDFTDPPCIIPQLSAVQDDNSWSTQLNLIWKSCHCSYHLYHLTSCCRESPSGGQSWCRNSLILQELKEELHHFEALKKILGICPSPIFYHELQVMNSHLQNIKQRMFSCFF